MNNEEISHLNSILNSIKKKESVEDPVPAGQYNTVVQRAITTQPNGYYTIEWELRIKDGEYEGYKLFKTSQLKYDTATIEEFRNELRHLNIELNDFNELFENDEVEGTQGKSVKIDYNDETNTVKFIGYPKN